MKHYFLTTATVALSLMGSVLVPALNADELNKSTTITIDQSIDVQGIVLPAGSYVIKRLRSSTDPARCNFSTPLRTTSSPRSWRLQPIG